MREKKNAIFVLLIFFCMVALLAYALLMQFQVKHLEDDNENLKHELSQKEKVKVKPSIPKSSPTKSNTDKKVDANQNELMNLSETFVNNMMNQQNDSNYSKIKKEMANITTQNFMDKFLKSDHPENNLPVNTKIDSVTLFLEQNQNASEIKKGIVTFFRDVYVIENQKVTDELLAKEKMTVELTFMNQNGKWIIDKYEILNSQEKNLKA
ncbi:hypothetical protein JGZ01_04010 [Staphylococcus pseudintermedius]|uniref:hypothetical protein n=2 Tax=Staphylococcus pseudintermedius TaxID=283734 RepID=UPI00080C87F1|nr:hypothetical protein [Staphylococcus pseudintermedius]EGQ1293108.1 hypothetical protein [Staphylococcus pseudintermedius]EGQ1655177.1 hypothetical protein [Staphylococcus pseudintermedius]EGQ1700168.1 hypothetical protein [Staphylococcus pseudintermedius]EGQ1719673.1 hypothetical protein [Staphylococcus pseudintermedius]EGQ2955623.1 hypothetical protein [Staphylococcus pseudintermedius]